MSKCALRHWSGYSGDCHAGKSGKHVPRHASKSPGLKDYLPSGKTGGTVVALIGGAVLAIGCAIDASIDNHGKVSTSIQRPMEEEPDEGTDKSLQPTGLDSVDDQSPEARRIVIDGASRVSACDIRSQQGELGEDVKCVHPNIFAYLGANPAEGFSSNMLPASVDNRKQPTSA